MFNFVSVMLNKKRNIGQYSVVKEADLLHSTMTHEQLQFRTSDPSSPIRNYQSKRFRTHVSGPLDERFVISKTHWERYKDFSLNLNLDDQADVVIASGATGVLVQESEILVDDERTTAQVIALPEAVTPLLNNNENDLALYPSPSCDILRLYNVDHTFYSVTTEDRIRVSKADLTERKRELIDVSDLVEGTYQLIFI